MNRGDWLKSSAVALPLACGCGTADPTPPPAPARTPLAVHRAEPDFRVFSGNDEVPPATFRFEGADGFVRLTMEVESPASTATSPAPQINDVLFPVRGEGTLSVLFRRPTPEDHAGRVVIRCRIGESESTAEFEPTLWFGRPSAIVTFESRVGEPANAAEEGREVVLARYVARNAPSEIRLAFKAVFSKKPIGPRVKAGMKAGP